jgi:hypothetical protein
VKKLRLGLMCLLLAAVVLGCPAPGAKTYNIGDTGPAGGMVFYDQGSATNGWQYLEAAPYDQNSPIQWTVGGASATGATGVAVGTGPANTTAVIAVQGAGNYAAKVCKDLMLGGYSDWFLPSKDELTQMLQNLGTKGLGNLVSNHVYWSSTEIDSGNAWDVFFSGSTVTPTSNVKNNIGSARAVRRF